MPDKKPPFHRDQRVICVETSHGCPLEEGKEYIVRRCGPYEKLMGCPPDTPLPGNPAAVILFDPPGVFRHTRFKASSSEG